ncbi:MAG TPA: hypothetical protein VMT62_13550 [Syntrophorhabdaceae bacterium]|nr:hypothetical protein [Syntrophorhabdaceae bacterium]
MEYEVLSPWAEKDNIARGLQPRIANLENKTIGMFYYFFNSHVAILREIERQLKEKFPTLKFSYYQYTVETSEIEHDATHRESFEEWVKEVDTVISVYGNIPSPTLYIAYNTAYIERLGKPAIILTGQAGVNMARSGVSAKGFPELRVLTVDLPHISFGASGEIQDMFIPGIAKALHQIIEALTKPLTEQEKSPIKGAEKASRIIYKGGLEDVNRFFYKNGWSYGMPVIPPTEEAVREMLTGTDLPADHVVATLPPMLGKATVEKIAINAVMAGCLPTYLPVLIAGVKAMVDPRIKLEGYTCSMGCWEAFWIVNGPVRQALHINSGKALMSPYFRPNATIGLALGLILMNVSGVRTGMEEGAAIGHEGKFGVCFAENEEMSPWEPLHVQYGFKKEDSTITSFWPNNRSFWQVRGTENILNTITENIPAFGFDPGCAFILVPSVAKDLADSGYTKKDFMNYVQEYARKPIDESYLDWLVNAHHPSKGLVLPQASCKSSMRRFFSTEHMITVVAGSHDYFSFDIAAYGGGGDHGGPAITKMELPTKWEQLVKKYDDIVPHYGRY